MVTPDPKHEASRKALVKLDATELRRRIDIDDYRHADYVSSEVLASLVRANYGQLSGVLDYAVAKLYARLMTLIDRYFVKNPKWYKIVQSSSETLEEATSEAWVALLTDKTAVSFAEVRFLKWVEARTLDFLRQQLTKTNQMVSLETMSAKDDDGNEAAFENSLEDHEDNSPQAILERERLKAKLNALWMGFERLVRNAVYYRLECEYDWPKVAKLLGCSVPTARKHYKIGIERLNKEL